MSDLAATLITIIVISVIGWVIAIWISSRAASKREGKYEERINNVVERINALPCEKDPKHEIDLGKIIGKAEGLHTSIKALQDQLALQNLTIAEGISNLDKRIDTFLTNWPGDDQE